MVELVYFLAGVLLPIGLSKWFAEFVERRRRHITWRRFWKCLTDPRVLGAISNHKPDVIVGLNCGIVPASILAINLKTPLYFYDLLQDYESDGTRVDVPIPKCSIDLVDKDILVVDDQLYSGDSLRRFRDHLVTNEDVVPERIRRFSVFRYKSPAAQAVLDVPSPCTTSGVTKRVPWIVSERLERFHELRK